MPSDMEQKDTKLKEKTHNLGKEILPMPRYRAELMPWVGGEGRQGQVSESEVGH